MKIYCTMEFDRGNGALQVINRSFEQDEDDDQFIIALWLHITEITLYNRGKKRDSSIPGKPGNGEQYYEEAHKRYMLKYFWPLEKPRPLDQEIPSVMKSYGPNAPEREFGRRFRMAREISSNV